MGFFWLDGFVLVGFSFLVAVVGFVWFFVCFLLLTTNCNKNPKQISLAIETHAFHFKENVTYIHNNVNNPGHWIRDQEIL